MINVSHKINQKLNSTTICCKRDTRCRGNSKRATMTVCRHNRDQDSLLSRPQALYSKSWFCFFWASILPTRPRFMRFSVSFLNGRVRPQRSVDYDRNLLRRSVASPLASIRCSIGLAVASLIDWFPLMACPELGTLLAFCLKWVLSVALGTIARTYQAIPFFFVRVLLFPVWAALIFVAVIVFSDTLFIRLTFSINRPSRPWVFFLIEFS